MKKGTPPKNAADLDVWQEIMATHESSCKPMLAKRGNKRVGSGLLRKRWDKIETWGFFRQGGVVFDNQWKGRIRGTLQVWFLHTFLILSSPSSQVLIISSCSLNVIILFYCVVNCAEFEFSCLLCFGSFPVTWIPLMNNCCVILLFWAQYLINRIITPGFLHLF